MSICRPGQGGPAEDPFHSLTEICHQTSCLQWGQGTGNGAWGQPCVPTCQLNWKLTLPLRAALAENRKKTSLCHELMSPTLIGTC